MAPMEFKGIFADLFGGVPFWRFFLSKIFPTIIWSAIQFTIIIIFAAIYMTFPCSDFVVPDEDSSCTDAYKKSTSKLCA